MSQSPYIKSIRVSAWEVRRIFNEGRFVERGESGELEVRVTRSRVLLDETVRNWTPGTMSEEVRYFENGILVAKAHRYRRPDGKLAASGMADPKRVVWNNVMYIVDLD